MAKESDKYFLKLRIGKIYFKDKYRIDFYSGNPNPIKVGNFLRLVFDSTIESDPFLGGYLNKKQVKNIIRYLNKLMERDDAIEE